MINQKVLDKEIKIHKKTIANLFHNHNEIINFEEIVTKIKGIKRSGSEISLVVADFKCQRCGGEKDLQWHHLISRKVKEYVDKIRYISVRHYFGNIIILCKSCHHKYHTEKNITPTEKDEEEKTIITPTTINKIKKKYLIKENDIQ